MSRPRFSSLSLASELKRQKIELVGSLRSCSARSEPSGGNGREKLYARCLAAHTAESKCDAEAFRYHFRVERCLIRSRGRVWWPHGNCAMACCTNWCSGHASAKAHIFQVARAEALDTWIFSAEILGKTIDDLAAPSLRLLSIQNVPPDRPLEEDELPVDGEGGAHLGGAGTLFDFFEQVCVNQVATEAPRSCPQGMTSPVICRK